MSSKKKKKITKKIQEIKSNFKTINISKKNIIEQKQNKKE